MTMYYKYDKIWTVKKRNINPITEDTMRYYEVYLPEGRGNADEPIIATNVRRMQNLATGTRVWRIITDRDGTLIESEELAVNDGKVIFHRGAAKHIAQIHHG